MNRLQKTNYIIKYWETNLDKKIGNVVKQTYILNYSLPKEYDPVENDPEFKALKEQTIQIIDEGINKKFKHLN
jgi:hypothetical protein